MIFFNSLKMQKFIISADGIMIVFSITDEGSFEMLKELHQQVERNISESVSYLKTRPPPPATDAFGP